MASEIITPPKDDTGFEAIYLGPVKLKGGKTGEQWILASAYKAEASAVEMDAVSSYFQFKGRGSRPIGGVYECKGEVADGHIQHLNERMLYRRFEQGPVIDAFKARKLVRDQDASRVKMMAKAKESDALKMLAERVAAHAESVPWGDRSSFLAAFTDLVRKAIEEKKYRHG